MQLTEEDRDFLQYWESHREQEKTFKRAMIIYGPIGLIFGLPILLSVLFDGWYKRMMPLTKGQMIMVLIIVASVVVFYSYFKQQRVWDRKEQHYKQLKLKEQLPERG